jgi:hypothetical protein
VLDERVQRLVIRILYTSLLDNYNAWEQLPDDSYVRVQPAPGESVIDSHQIYMQDSAGLDEGF